MRRVCLVAILLLSALGTTSATAGQIIFSSVTGTPTFYNSLTLLNDGIFPGEGGAWQTNTVWWNGTAPTFTFDLGALYVLDDVVLSVDNNDSYGVQYSTDNSTWLTLFNISSAYGEIGWGMDTMSTKIGDAEYIAGIDFIPLQARSLRIFATGGDNSYSLGEFQAFGTLPAPAVPEPTSLLLLGTGLGGLALAAGRKRK